MKKILAGVVLCLSLFLFVGCGSDELKGTWSNAVNDEYKATFIFDGKGEATYKDQFGNEGTGSYTIKDDEVTFTDVWDIEMVYKFTLKDGKLSLTATNGYSPNYKDLTKE